MCGSACLPGKFLVRDLGRLYAEDAQVLGLGCAVDGSVFLSFVDDLVQGSGRSRMSVLSILSPEPGCRQMKEKMAWFKARVVQEVLAFSP